MANEKTTTENVVYTAKVTKVMLPSNSSNRVSLVTDAIFEVVDFTTGEVKNTSIIGINTYNLVNQLAKVGGADYISLADALCMGKAINPQIVSLSLLNAEIKFKRHLHHAGEEREIEGTYSTDCYTTEIVSCKTNINDVSKRFLENLLMTQPCAKVEEEEAKPTSFNI